MRKTPEQKLSEILRKTPEQKLSEILRTAFLNADERKLNPELRHALQMIVEHMSEHEEFFKAVADLQAMVFTSKQVPSQSDEYPDNWFQVTLWDRGIKQMSATAPTFMQAVSSVLIGLNQEIKADTTKKSQAFVHGAKTFLTAAHAMLNDLTEQLKKDP